MTQVSNEELNKEDMRQMTGLGRKIENNSFAIIDAEVGTHSFPSDQWEVVRRIIHATADFEFKNIACLSDDAVEAGIKALKAGCNIIVDVKMIAVGLNQNRLDAYGCKVHSFISDENVIKEAKQNNSTRAIVSMQKAKRLELLDGSIIAIGNAPTALIEIARMIRQESIKPALIIGVPVGFVSAVESKEEILSAKVPYIITRGRKGGTTIAVSIIHALLLLSKESAV
ncbi:Cobalt-precorrin-8 methylmutase [hydrothermal vent metagenome]|uniref:Cobalt-precorrin-8 methylmutase n=1 Tax=hydrothermal vent metagenome TaxID=652676 RepID=A0A3B1D495_9ZZZZ